MLVLNLYKSILSDLKKCRSCKYLSSLEKKFITKLYNFWIYKIFMAVFGVISGLELDVSSWKIVSQSLDRHIENIRLEKIRYRFLKPTFWLLRPSQNSKSTARPLILMKMELTNYQPWEEVKNEKAKYGKHQISKWEIKIFFTINFFNIKHSPATDVS